MPLALISPPLASQPDEATPEEVLRHPPREARPLARLGTSQGSAPREGLECLLVKMGRTGPLTKPRHGLQIGKSGVPHS